MVYRRVLVSRSQFKKLPKYALFALQATPTTQLVSVSRREYVGNGAGETTISDVSSPVVRIPLVHLW